MTPVAAGASAAIVHRRELLADLGFEQQPGQMGRTADAEGRVVDLGPAAP